MYCISDEQIEYILNDIRRNGVETEDLQLNLLDHICCIIEQNLEDKDGFEDFYKETIRRFYKKELREIEEETINLLTFKNYYAMKKVMIACGAVSVAAFIFGSFFKIMHWPGAGPLLFFAILLVSLVFLPLLFILKIKEVSATRDRVILAIGTLAGIMYFLSMLLQVMHLPGRRELWLVTLAISFFVFIPIYFFTGFRKPETRVNTIVSTILLVSAIGVQFTMTAIRPPQKDAPANQPVVPEKTFIK